MTQEQVDQYRETTTREIVLPQGGTQSVRMPQLLWDNLDFLQTVEGITPTELVPYALEEMELQKISFDNAYRAVVAHLANRWQ